MNQQTLLKNFRYEDGNIIRLNKLGGQPAGAIAGWVTTCNSRQYKKMSLNRKTVYVHHAIFLYHHGYLPKYIDHIDNNPLNNKIENLRPSTQSQNLGNSRIRRNNTSGYKGVTFRKDTGKWQAAVMINAKHISLGSHVTKEEAYEAYIAGSKKYFGEFANDGSLV
jgi:hypothetical protein